MISSSTYNFRTVVSLFNGMGTLRQAMHNQNIACDKYYSSEIKDYANKLQEKHFPDVIQVGDVRNWRSWDIDWSQVDFIGSGSPCQDLSFSGLQAGLSGNKSSLFWVFVEILNHAWKHNPNVLFLQENVGSAPSIDVGTMSRALGVYPVRINSRLVVPQTRNRLYWTNIRTKKDGMFGDLISDIPQPADRKPLFQDILDHGTAPYRYSSTLTEREYKNLYKDMDKFKVLLNRCKVKRREIPLHAIDVLGRPRNLTKSEFCKLQGFPGDYCMNLPIRKTVSLLGDGWTLPIIEHILSFISPF